MKIQLELSWENDPLCFSTTDCSVCFPTFLHLVGKSIQACWGCPLIGHFEVHWQDTRNINKKLTETQMQLGK